MVVTASTIFIEELNFFRFVFCCHFYFVFWANVVSRIMADIIDSFWDSSGAGIHKSII